MAAQRIRHQATASKTIARLQQQVEHLQQQVVVLRQALKAAEQVASHETTIALIDANAELLISALHAEEVAESAMSELDEITRTSQLDALTGTPNRAMMRDRLDSTIALSRRHETRAALLFLDLDGFKQINDTQGHAVGDTVLCMVTRSLESVIRDSDTVSRHGGDEFLVLLAEISQPADAALIAAKILDAVGKCCSDILLTLSGSVGIAIYPEDDQEAAVLIVNADAAMYRSKKRGRGGFAFFSESGDGPLR